MGLAADVLAWHPNRTIVQKLRVLHVNKLYAPAIGGVEAVVQALAEETASSGELDVRVLACQPRGRSSEDLVNGVPVQRVGSLGTAWSMPVAPAFPLVLRAIRREFDVVHLHMPFPLPAFAGWSRDAGAPRLIIHYHCDVARPFQRAVLKLMEPLSRRMFECADRIIVTSERMLLESPALAPYKEKCSVIPLPAGVPAVRQASSSERARARERFGVSPIGPIVLFVGRLVYYKGLQHLLTAMAQIDATLLVVGEGPLRETLLGQVEALKLQKRTRFVGSLGSDDLQLAYELADVFVLPSTERAEAFGLVQVEAMQHGCPVVNTDLPTGVPSVSVDGMTGLTVSPGDAPGLANAIRTLLGDEALRKRFSAAARRRAMNFDRAVITRQVLDLYREVTGTSPEAHAPRFGAGLAAG